MKRRTYLVTLAGVATLSGCTGRTRSSATGETESSPSTTASESVVQYSDLSDEGKDVFEALLETDSQVGAESEFPDDIWNAEYVEYEGTVYAIQRGQTGAYIAEYSLHTEFVNEAAVGDETDVVAFEELTPSAQDAFETSRYEGRFETREQLPRQFAEYRFVRYEGDYYELTRVVADIPEWELSATKAEGV